MTDLPCVIHHWKTKNLLFPTVHCNVKLVKPFGNYALLNTRSTAKNLHSRRDHNLSAWNIVALHSAVNISDSPKSMLVF